jgi:hypothetical protein
MSFLQRIRRIDIDSLYYGGVVASSFVGTNLFVFDTIKHSEKIKYSDIFGNAIFGCLGGAVVGFLSPVIITAGVFSIPGYIIGKITK